MSIQPMVQRVSLTDSRCVYLVTVRRVRTMSGSHHLPFGIQALPSHFDVLSCHNSKNNNPPLRIGKLHICDFAGSERLGKSDSHGNLLKETQAINKSLMNLSNVIEKLQAGDASPHIPYRDSKLTHLLQDSVGGDSKMMCVVC
jgi:hypothetical protein